MNKIRILTVLCASLLFVLPSAPADEIRSDEAWEEIRQALVLYQQEKYVEAFSRFDGAVKRFNLAEEHKNDASFHKSYFEFAFEAEEWETALRECNLVIGMDPECESEYLSLSGKLSARLGDFATAERMFTRYIAATPAAESHTQPTPPKAGNGIMQTDITLDSNGREMRNQNSHRYGGGLEQEVKMREDLVYDREENFIRSEIREIRKIEQVSDTASRLEGYPAVVYGNQEDTTDKGDVYIETFIESDSNGSRVERICVGSRSDFEDYTAAIYGESSGNIEESKLIASIIKKRSLRSLATVHSTVSAENQINGYNANTIKETLDSEKSNVCSANMTMARFAALDIMSKPVDISNRTYFWEGIKYLDSNSDAYNPNNYYIRTGWGDTVGISTGKITYTETARFGGTVFMEYNKAVMGNQIWP